MKKLWLVLMSAALIVSAEENTVSLFSLFNAANSPKKIKSVQSAKIVYSIAGTDLDTTSYLVIRANKKNQKRLDLVSQKEIYTVCQDLDNYWGCDTEHGVVRLSLEDIRELKRDFAFLPLPFAEKNIFAPLQESGSGLYRDTACTVYKTYVEEQPSTKFSIWINSNTKTATLVKTEINKELYATSFQDYQDYEGIKIANVISCSGPATVYTMNLHSVDWNPSFPDTLFKQGVTKADNVLILLQKSLKVHKPAVKIVGKPTAKKKTAADPKKKKVQTAQIDYEKKIMMLEREVKNLTIKLDAKQQRMDQLAATSNKAYNDAIDLSKTSIRNGGGWAYRGWGHWGTSSSGRESRRAARKLSKLTSAALEEYQQISRQVVELRLQLSDTQLALQYWKKQQAAAKKREAEQKKTAASEKSAK